MKRVITAIILSVLLIPPLMNALPYKSVSTCIEDPLFSTCVSKQAVGCSQLFQNGGGSDTDFCSDTGGAGQNLMSWVLNNNILQPNATGYNVNIHGGGQFNTTGSVNLSSSLYVDSSTNRIGIGTSSPQSKLHINSSVGTWMTFQTGGASTDANFQIVTFDWNWLFKVDQSESGKLRIGLGNGIGSGGINDMLSLTSDKRVGIGTRYPTNNLTVNGETNTTELIVHGLSSCDTIDTTPNGTFICGTDAGGSNVMSWNLIGNTFITNTTPANVNITGNLTVTERIYIKDADHWITENAESIYGVTADQAIWFHHDKEKDDGEITFIFDDQNKTLLWLQSGLNNSFSGLGNSFGLIPNYIGRENFSENGIINITRLGNYNTLCAFYGFPCKFEADTRGRAKIGIPGGPLLYTMGDLEVWRIAVIHEGLEVDETFSFSGKGGNDFDVINSSIYVSHHRIEEVDVVSGETINLIDENFDDGSITPFVQITSGGGASEWIAVIASECHEGECARAEGGPGKQYREMATNITTSDFVLDNLSFYLTTINLDANDLFNVSMSDNEGTEVLVFSITGGEDATNNFTIVGIPSSMDDKAFVTVKFGLDSGNVNEKAFVDFVILNATATTGTKANITIFDSTIIGGDGDGSVSIKYNGTANDWTITQSLKIDDNLTIGDFQCWEGIDCDLVRKEANITCNIIRGATSVFEVC